jgi:hypothetical protein
VASSGALASSAVSAFAASLVAAGVAVGSAVAAAPSATALEVASVADAEVFDASVAELDAVSELDGCSDELLLESDGAADATPFAIDIPMPKATAKPPTRPMEVAQRISTPRVKHINAPDVCRREVGCTDLATCYPKYVQHKPFTRKLINVSGAHICEPMSLSY